MLCEVVVKLVALLIELTLVVLATLLDELALVVDTDVCVVAVVAVVAVLAVLMLERLEELVLTELAEDGVLLLLLLTDVNEELSEVVVSEVVCEELVL